MSQFKRFNTSEHGEWNSGAAYPQGTLTWDPDNGLRIHDGSTSGGNPIGGGSSTVYWGDIENKPYGTTAVHDLIGGSSSEDNGKFLKQNSLGNSIWAFPNVLQYNNYQLTVLETGVISLPNNSTIDNQKHIDHIVGGADIQIGDLAYATEGSPGGAVINGDSYTNSGWQYIMFNDETIYNNVTGMTGTSNGYWPVTWAEGSTQRTGYVVIQFLGGFQFQICPVLNDTDGNNTPVSGTWKFPLNLRGSVVYNGNITFTVSSDNGNNDYTLGDTGYITLPAGGLLSDTKFDAQDPSTFGASLTGVGYSQLYWDGAPGTGNPFEGSDLFTWMYTDGNGITLGYVNAELSKDYQWRFDTDGKLQLPSGGDIVDSNGTSVLGGGAGGNPFNQDLNTSNSVEFAGLYINGGSANEGGEIRLAKAQTNTTLVGTGVTIDVYENRLRIFEQGGDARGYYLDISAGGNSATTNLASLGGTGYTGSAGTNGSTGYTGSAGTNGDVGYTGSAGPAGANGTSVRIVGTMNGGNPAYDLAVGFPTPVAGDGVIDEITGNLWVYSGTSWSSVGQIKGDIGYTGSAGTNGEVGYTGSAGANGNDGAPGMPGNDGSPGMPGNDGAPGAGVPTGGTAGQVLAKIDSGDYNTEWVNQSGGTTLPPDSAGVLKNDGTGSLSWGSLDVQDLTDNGNVLSFTQEQANWTENNAASPAYIQNKPFNVSEFSNDAGYVTGSPWNDQGFITSASVPTNVSQLSNDAGYVTGMPWTSEGYITSASVPTNVSQLNNDAGYITGTPWQNEGYATSASLASVATSGSYNDLSDTPSIPTDLSDLTDNTNLLTGVTGSQGEVGYTGSKGEVGYTGSAGTNGTNGATGQGFTFKGAWDPGSTYYAYDVVADNGNTFVCTQTSPPNTPVSNTAYWNIVAQRGDIGYTGSAGTNGEVGYTGSAGTNGTNGEVGYTGSQGSVGATGPIAYQQGSPFAWTNVGPYNANDVVSYGGSYWILSNPTGYIQSPTPDAGYGWTQFNLIIPGSNGNTGYTGSAGTNGTNGEVGYTGSQGSVGATGPTIEMPFSVQTTSFTAVVGGRYAVNTATGAVTITLPASAATGDAIFIADAGGAYSTNNLTVARNGLTIMGLAQDLTVSTDNESFGVFYNGSTWRLY